MEPSITGTPEDDIITGTNGTDLIAGYDGNDQISGGDDDDTIYGGSGHDYLYGQDGNDTLFGGSGNDRFVFTSNSGSNVITDFTSGDDVINLVGFGIADWSELAIADNLDGDAVIDLGSADITLQGIDTTQLGESDFLLS